MVPISIKSKNFKTLLKTGLSTLRSNFGHLGHIMFQLTTIFMTREEIIDFAA